MSKLYRLLPLLLWLARAVAPAAPLPIVLSTEVEIRVSDTGLAVRADLETFATDAPTQAFPVVSGAGSLLSWSASPDGAYSMVDPTEAAPGSPAFRQRRRGQSRLSLRFWQPAKEGEHEVVLRLPPTPEGRWRIEGLRPETPVDAGAAAGLVASAGGTLAGDIPDNGLLFLSWGGGERAATSGFLEASRVRLTVLPDTIEYEAHLEGYQPSRTLKIGWGEGVQVESGDDPGGAVTTARDGGVEVHGLPGDWFSLDFRGRIDPEAGDLAVTLPHVIGLAPASQGSIDIVPKAARRVTRQADAAVDGCWTTEALPRGVRRERLVPGKAPVPVLYRVSGWPVEKPEGARVARMQAETRPLEDPESPLLFASDIEIRLAEPGSLSLSFPGPVRVRRATFGDIDLTAPRAMTSSTEALQTFPRELDGGGLTLSFDHPGKLHLSLEHTPATSLPLFGELDVRLPIVEATPEQLRWTGRIPAHLAFGGLIGTPTGGAPPRTYLLRWMEDALEGIGVILHGGSLIVGLGVAMLLALYASLFLRPPNRQSMYVVAMVVALFGLVYQLAVQVQSRPAGPDPAAVAPPGDGSMFDRVRRWRFGSLFPGAAHPGAADPRGAVAGGQEPLSDEALAGGLGVTRPGEFAVPRVPWGDLPGFGGRASSPAAAGGAPATAAPERGSIPAAPGSEEEVEPPDWEVVRFPDEGGVMAFGVTASVAKEAPLRWVGILIGVLGFLGVLWARFRGKPEALALTAAAAVALLPLDWYFPRPVTTGGLILLAGAVLFVLHRLITEGLITWERVKDEIEQRRLQAISPRRAPAMRGDRDTGGGLYAGSALQENEASYDDVFPEDDGITFIMGEG